MPKETKASEFRKMMEMNEDVEDEYIADYSAAYLNKILLHGRLWLFRKHVCFYSNILGKVTKLVVPCGDVLRMEKTTYMMVPNALKLILNPGQRHSELFFGSLLSKQETFKYICEICNWPIPHPRDHTAPTALRNGDISMKLKRSPSHSGQRTPLTNGRRSQKASSSLRASPRPSPPKPLRLSSSPDLRNTSKSPPPLELRPSDAPSSEDGAEKEKLANLQKEADVLRDNLKQLEKATSKELTAISQASQKGDDSLVDSLMQKYRNGVDKQYKECQTELQQRENDIREIQVRSTSFDIQLLSSDGFPLIDQALTAEDLAYPEGDGVQMKTDREADFPCTPLELFKKFYGHGDDPETLLSQVQFHMESGDLDGTETQWSLSSGEGGPPTYERKVTYTHIPKNPPMFAPKTVECIVDEKVRFYGRDCFLYCYLVKTPGVPTGDTFEVLGRHVVHATEDGKACRWSNSVGIRFVKSNWIKSIIRNKTFGDSPVYAGHWYKRALGLLTAEQNGTLASLQERAEETKEEEQPGEDERTLCERLSAAVYGVRPGNFRIGGTGALVCSLENREDPKREYIGGLEPGWMVRVVEVVGNRALVMRPDRGWARGTGQWKNVCKGPDRDFGWVSVTTTRLGTRLLLPADSWLDRFRRQLNPMLLVLLMLCTFLLLVVLQLWWNVGNLRDEVRNIYSKQCEAAR